MDWKYIGKEGNYLKYAIEKDGFTYYIIAEQDNLGNIRHIFEKPDLRQLSNNIHASGAHLVIHNPKENHYDHYYQGREWREDQTKFEYPFWYSNNPLGI